MTQLTTEKTVQPGPYRDVVTQNIMRAAWLFLPAWTLDFTAAWVLLAVMVVGDVATRRYLVRNDPAMVERRRAAKPTAELRPYQRFAYLMVNVLFLGGLALTGLDHRNDWSQMPVAVSVVGFALVVASMYVVFLAFRANTFASATVTLHDEHRVISTGPYARVRHPMYSGLLLLMLGAPLALGCWWGLVTLVLFAAVLAGRILDEEKFLKAGLPGYTEYTDRVRYRVIPAIW